MATTRTANTHWEGPLMGGSGTTTLDSSGLGQFDVDWPARAEQPGGKTSPEELIAAAHSACYSMALSGALAKAGNPPQSVDTRADVTFQPGQGITGIAITVRAVVPGRTRGVQSAAEDAKQTARSARRYGHHDTIDATLDE